MCRIAGIASIESVTAEIPGLTRMLNSMAHGGPDDEGLYCDDKIALGHRRLAIIDLSASGHQPMIIDDGSLIISFNGEIYNYKELRSELEDLGATFQTQTDTEVILVAYKKWKKNCFDRFEGIFAFALYDKIEGKLLLVRDHIGVKPLYYHRSQKKLIFSSEVRAFKALTPGWKPNEDWKVLFLAFGSIPHPATTLKDVFQLSPGSYLELDLNTFRQEVKFYYQPSKNQFFFNSAHGALRLMHGAMRDALKKNLISDAPLGVFLSGGIDSSLLTLMADRIQKQVKAISVNFKETFFDERKYQRIVIENSQGVNLFASVLTDEKLWEQLDDIWMAMDQPSIDGVNSYFVSRYAREAGLKVVLSGLGADEIFGGYSSFNRIRYVKRLRRIPFKRAIAKILGIGKHSLKRFMFLTIPGVIGDYLFLRGIHTPDSIATILNIPEAKVWSILENVRINAPVSIDDQEYASFLETNIYMTNQLLKDADCMSMWHGLELRVPYLDIVLIKKVNQINPKLRTMRGWPKYLLTASSDNILPHEIVFREKKGFTFPFALWMKKNPERIRGMLPTSKASLDIFNEFERGHSHWSQCWSLAVANRFSQ